MHPRRIVPAWPSPGKRDWSVSWRSCGSVGRCILAKRRSASRTGRSSITGAARRTPRRICSTRFITVACSGLRAAEPASASTRRPSVGLIARCGGVRARVDALIDLVIRIYAPLPRPSLSTLSAGCGTRCRSGSSELKAGLRRAHERLPSDRVDGVDWYWPADEDPRQAAPDEAVRLLSPFDPVVWDRRRFELLWGWVSVRGLHAGRQTEAGVLRAAAAVAGSRDRLGQRLQAAGRVAP